MPYSSTRAAAASSWVESGFEAHRTTSAPPAWSVRIRFAVSVVTWRHADTRKPASGRSRENRSRIARRTGMLRSAHSIRRTPSGASARSLTSYRLAPAIGRTLRGRCALAAVRVLEPHDIAEIGCRHPDDQRVLDRAHAVDRAGNEVEAVAGPDLAGVEPVRADAAELELGAALVDVPG